MKSSAKPSAILRVAIGTPLRTEFDYLPPAGVDPASLIPGVRVRIPFGRTRQVGLLMECSDSSALDPKRLKRAYEIIDEVPILTESDLTLLRWASAYYHHPIGDVIQNALPVLLRRGEPAAIAGIDHWDLTDAGRKQDIDTLVRAPRQQELLRRLGEAVDGLAAQAFAELDFDWRTPMRRLVDQSWVIRSSRDFLVSPTVGESAPMLNQAQRIAVEKIQSNMDSFAVFLLDGVTGSGKTEVYLQTIEQVLAANEQSLVLVPEIGLTPQLVARFRRRFDCPVVVLHSGLNDRERLNAWLLSRSGEAGIVLGTRSAIFTPMPNLGLIVVDEEHDASLKQQDGFRYSARDLAVMRARNRKVPVLLGSATPSLESLQNSDDARYQHLSLPERAGQAVHPEIRVLDMRGQPIYQGLSEGLRLEIRKHLDNRGQVLLFLNRRGYAPTLICHDCGWIAECKRCDAHMTMHRHHGRMICHHCGSEHSLKNTCPKCDSSDLIPVGKGTERVEQTLKQLYPDVPITRIDRDTTRRKGSLEAKLAEIKAGEPCVLIGTQMLAKGHHFPNVTLAAILDADRGLFGVDFRAGERMAQLIVQVAGRAGRADRPGVVLVQTHHPDHPLLQILLRQDYRAFATEALEERRQALLPPFSRMVLWRAEAPIEAPAHRFLEEVRDLAFQLGVGQVEILGPVPAPMERRAGRYRAQLLMQAEARALIHPLISALLLEVDKLKTARRVRWSLDVDPVDML